MFRKVMLLSATVVLLIATLLSALPNGLRAASHREAPLIALDPGADISDFFMFRSYEPGKEDKVVLLMDVVPGQEPSSGPNYWNFDPNVLYTFSIDNNADGIATDVIFEVRFQNEIRGVIRDLTLPLSYVALPPITALDGPGSEGLGLRQSYTVTMVTRGKREVLASGLFAVPSNVGPRTMPDYASLAVQGIYSIDKDIRVFAGQREDPFYIDLGATFDTLNFRRSPLPLLSVEEDADDTQNAFGIDQLGSFNVSTIALEVPASLLTRDGKSPDETAQSTIGAYAATARRAVRVLRTQSGSAGRDALKQIGEMRLDRDRGTDTNDRSRTQFDFGPWIQVQRLANPLVNELIIGTVDKDHWNATMPRDEFRFEEYYLNPRLALAMEVVFGVPAAKENRTDLRDLLLKYSPGDRRLAELLRLDLSVAPTPFADQKRLGPLAHDAAGNPTPDPAAWPNGRRPKDDVTDIAIRVIGGANYIAAYAGDGINVDSTAPLSESFPFLANPTDGVNRVSINP
jgi:hypothetical protein